MRFCENKKFHIYCVLFYDFTHKTRIVVEMERIVRKMNLDIILDKCFGYAFDRNMYYYDSIDSYYSGEEPSFWRKVKFYSRILVLMITTVKSGLSTLFPETLLLTPLTDSTLIYGKQSILVNAVIFGLGLITLSAKLMLGYYESKNNLKVFDIIVDLKARKQKYRMSQKHIKKITIRTGLLYYGYIRIIGSCILFSSIICTTCATIGTYLYCDYGNVIILWLWTIILNIYINQILIIVLYGTLWFYLPITVLNYRSVQN